MSAFAGAQPDSFLARQPQFGMQFGVGPFNGSQGQIRAAGVASQRPHFKIWRPHDLKVEAGRKVLGEVYSAEILVFVNKCPILCKVEMYGFGRAERK